MPKSTSPDLALRKKMRKGTHSCFECRRRKIRCIFPPDNPNVCSECFARGSRCIDQEHAATDVIVDHRKNLRERVSRLEALVDSLLEERTDQSPADSTRRQTMVSDPLPPTPLSSEASSSAPGPISTGGHAGTAPLLSVFEDALNNVESQYAKSEVSYSAKDGTSTPSRLAPEPYRITCSEDHRLADDCPEKSETASKLKRERARQNLIDVLPPYEQLMPILNSNGEWWATWRKKTAGTSGNMTLPQYATYALSEGSPGAVGILVLGVGICCESDDIDRYINTVDRWVLADDEYAATLEGMECLILEAKWYADIGQPRRAWLAYRRGLMYAQLLGLHRKRTPSVAHESIWWSLYHGDRFLCLLLGLPYGVSDAHCDLTIPGLVQSGPYMPPLLFANKISMMAGKVIDRNQGIGEQSFAFVLELDQEMEDLYNKLDPSWTDVAGAMVDGQTTAADLRERLLIQILFHQIRVYLHLPFMLKSTNNPRYGYSRTACITGSREMLRLYQSLRCGAGEPLYECKAIDFLGFTAAILLMLGMFGNGPSVPNPSPQEQEKDWRLIEICIDIFRRASTEKGGKVAAQSYAVLENMRRAKDPNCEKKDDPDCLSSFVIPYFGTITIRRGDKPVIGPNADKRTPSCCSSVSATQYTPPVDTDSMFDQSADCVTQDNLNPDTFIAYDGFYLQNNNPTQLDEDGMGAFPPATTNFSWQNMPMDIDQDWSWFLNDGQVQMPNQQLNLEFSPQNYIGL
ncbi:hypothetical protein AOQ84DRAFT_361401 [Glonium stellatum]|uniref:Zn(2)-C6 fungal-type domain-containing protein n=1 Tax=Glonium stellatum TaxID=574774 RepID=A0A8E2F6W6_9PEZI|nr:hypothetical protein AOQ84DRAFT_361401 [Glonium stellatum]